MQDGNSPDAMQNGIVRVLIVDDHPLVRAGLLGILRDEHDLEVCGEAETLEQALDEVQMKRPELVITDVSLRDGGGIELVKRIAARFPETRLVVTSMHDESIYAERALRAGAMAYVSKTEPPSVLLAAIRDALHGRIHCSDFVRQRFIERAGTAESDRASIQHLSDRELEVFEMLGQGKTTREIAEALGLAQKTIETYREKIKQKLGLENANQLIRHAVEWVDQEA